MDVDGAVVLPVIAAESFEALCGVDVVVVGLQ